MAESRPHPSSEGLPPIRVPGDCPDFPFSENGTVPFNVAVPAAMGPPSRSTVAAAAKQPESEQPAHAAIPVMTLVLENSPPWLVSMVFHMLLLIIMGLVVFSQIQRNPVQLSAEVAVPDKVGEQLDTDSPPGLPQGSDDGTGDVLTPDNLPPVDDPLGSPGKVPIRPGGHLATSDVEAPGLSWVLRGRTPGGSRDKAARGKGGSDLTQAAVARGLEWLARNQRPDGSWSLAGPYSDATPKFNDCEAAATAMALLAFQGDGNTHLEGKYKKNVANGWKWLLKQQDEAGCFFQNGGFNYRFYTQGQCSIAICELYAMSNDTKFKPPAQLAINYCLRSQSPEGGWRYTPNSDSDVSVTGWVVMALQSARMAGLSVPGENLQNVGKFLDSVAAHGGARYPYQKDGDVRRSMTAEALLMREYLGWKRNDRRLVDGINWITSPENLIDFRNNRDVYYWYYATQAAFHLEGDAWNRWNAVMRKALPEQQVLRGKEAGSWDPSKPSEDQWSRNAGRLYVTCLSIYMLEVYYRHMPLYSHVYSDGETAAKPAVKKPEKAEAQGDEGRRDSDP
jgi:hypothetical protein